MSAIIVLTPVIIASWPVITAAITAAVGTLGFAAARSAELEMQEQAATKIREEIEVDNSEILAASAGTEEKIIVQREGITATFSRDLRGGLRVCMEGQGHSKRELRRIGQELIDRVTQQYVYHRVVSELKERHMTIVDEEVAADRSVKIRVRHG
jgi:hypothetical protein